MRPSRNMRRSTVRLGAFASRRKIGQRYWGSRSKASSCISDFFPASQPVFRLVCVISFRCHSETRVASFMKDVCPALEAVLLHFQINRNNGFRASTCANCRSWYCWTDPGPSVEEGRY